MADLILSGSTSGSVTLSAPAVSGTTVLTLPTASGTVLSSVSDLTTQVKTATNASGSAPVFAARAWVNFNGTGTVAIRASGNVSSITDNGVGDYTVNFATAMPDVNYAGIITYGSDRPTSAGGSTAQNSESVYAASSSSAFRFFQGQSYSPFSLSDQQYLTVIITR